MHLIATRADLGTFAHVHPEPTGRAGEFAVTLTFPSDGRYVVHTEFRRNGEMSDVIERHEVVVGDAAAVAPVPVTESPREVVVGGLRVTLDGDVEAGHESELRFRFADAATGAPVRDLKPYLASAGHVIVIPADGSAFAHTHAEELDADGDPVFALPGTTFGPELTLHHHFDEPGLYRLWGQFRTTAGDVLTVPFTVEAS